MMGLFYKTYWPIVKDYVVVSVESFFRGGFILKEFNHTNIALIPKVDNHSLVNHFRPISLTSFNYKIISNILSNNWIPMAILIHFGLALYIQKTNKCQNIHILALNLHFVNLLILLFCVVVVVFVFLLVFRFLKLKEAIIESSKLKA